MSVSVNIMIKAPAKTVWEITTDPDKFSQVIKGIEKTEVLEKPKVGLVGLKWRETRVMFGKEATEVIWITEAKAHAYYQTRAESHGSVYKTTVSLKEMGNEIELTQTFSGEAQTFMAKIMSKIFASMITKSIKKCLLDDLTDIKLAAEAADTKK